MMKIRSKKNRSWRFLFVFIILIGPLPLSSPLWAQSTMRHSGGKNDGYTRGCVPPVIQNVKGLKNGGCIEDGNLYLSVQVTGTNVNYQWQKQNASTQLFEPYVPQSGSVVEGMNGPKLSFIQTTDLDNGYYRCVLSNDCSDEVISDTFFVDISSKPVIKSGLFDRNVCVGEQVMYNIVADAQGGPEYTYAWYKNGSVIGGINQSFYTFTAAASKETKDTYIVKVTNKCGSVLDTSQLTISVLPWIESFTDTVWVCRDSSVTLSVKLKEGGDYTYELYQVNYPSLEETLVWMGVVNTCILENISTSGVYRWKVNNDCGTVSGDLMYVKVEDSPLIALHPQSDTVCEGTTVLLNCEVVPAISQRLTYSWYKDGISVSKSPQNFLRLRNIAVKDAGAYRCEVNNSCPSVKTNVAYIGVRRKPQILIQPSALTYYCQGDSLILNVTVDNDLPVDSVRWFYGDKRLVDNHRIEGCETPVLKVRNLQAADVVNHYSVVVYNHCGQVKSNAVKVNLRYPARFVRNSSDDVDLILCGGDSQTLFVSATGSDTIRYTWTFNGKIVADGYSNRLVVNGGGLDASGEYVCQVQNSCGNDKVVSYVKQSMPLLSEFQGGGHYCAREKGVEACLTDPKEHTTYQLYKKNNSGKGVAVSAIVSGDTVSGSICYDNLQKGTYYVIARDTNSCERIMNGEILSVEDSLPIDYRMTVLREICEGEPDGDLLLEKSQNGIEYYLCRRNAAGGWDTLSAPYHGTGEALSLKNIGEGQYKLVAYNPLTGCSVGFTSVVSLVERPFPELYSLSFKGNDSVYCANAESNIILQYSQWNSGYTYQLKDDGGNYGNVLTGSSLIWKNLPEGSYTLAVTNNWGCTLETSVKEVKTQLPPTVYPLTGDPYFCASLSSKQIALAGSDPDYTYQLRSIGKGMSVDTVGTGTAIFFDVPVASGKYYVIATDNTPERCKSYTDTLELRRSDIKAQSRTIAVDYGSTTLLGVTVSGYIGSEDGLQYQWDNVDKLVGNMADKNPETTAITESRLYTVIVTDSVGCSDTATVLVRCYGGELKGEIRLSDCMTDAGDTVSICLGEKISFCGMVSGGFENRGFSYCWWDYADTLGRGTSIADYAPETDRYLYWKVTNGTNEVIDSVWIKVNELQYPGVMPDLRKSGLACEDSTVILSVSEKLDGLDYCLKKNGVVYNCPVEITDSIKWTLSPAEPGVYTVEISDGNCKLILGEKIEINRTPSVADLEGDSVYCAGSFAELKIKNAETGVNYWLYDVSTGNQLSKGVWKEKDVVFSGQTNGSYYVEAVAGECKTTGSPFSVREVALPDASLVFGFETAGIACAGNGNLIRIENTEAGKAYSLRKKGYTGEVDVLAGDGRTQTFKPVTAEGMYVIYAKDTLSGCEVMLSGVLTIEKAPSIPLVEGCSYCKLPGVTGCGIKLKYKESGMYYRLTDGTTDLDVLTEAGEFKTLPHGSYQVLAIDSLTGCRSLSVEVSIHEVASPQLLAVKGECIQNGQAAVISTLTPGEDNIRYVLYKDGTLTDRWIAGSGNIISFDRLTATGVYRIWAENSLGCGLFMEDSVVIYPPLKLLGDSLYAKGTYCGNEKDVVLSYPVSTPLWKYYITDGTWFSDTVSGDGKILEFSRLSHQPIRPGQYKLYAMTPCGSALELIATGTVADHKLPLQQRIVPDTLLLCVGEEIGVELEGSEDKVRYEIDYHSLSGEYVRTYIGLSGTGNSLTVGRFAATGIYKVYADNGCRVFMDSLVVVGGQLPQIKKLLGDEICLVPGIPGELHLSVSEREEGVSYYLYKDGNLAVDSLTSYYRPDTNGFIGQGQAGCYEAIAVHEESGCHMPVNGVRCMGSISATFGLLPDGGDTVKLCNKSKYCLSLEGSEKGVGYILYRNRTDSVQILAGTGGPLAYACVTKGGSYRVKAKVAGCELWMSDSVYVELMDRPVLALKDTFRFCEGEAGVHIRLTSTESTLIYTLYTPDGRQEVRNGSAHGGALEFADVSYLTGYYYVEAYDPVGGCYAKDSTVVVMQTLPMAHDLWSEQGHYICVDGSVTLTLAGSQKDIEYGLFRTGKTDAIVTRQGTGAALQFGKIKDPGNYYVMATARMGEKCQNDFGAWELKLADTVHIHKVTGIKNNYCFTDAEKGSVGLNGSHKGVEYELLRDGMNTGFIQAGTGAPLIWNNVSGKTCTGVPGEMNTGYKYSVIARDTLTGCKAYMYGLDTVIESGNVAVWAYQPNESVEKCEGENIDFNVLTSGCGEIYTWYHEDTVIYTGKKNYFNLDSIKGNSAGIYYCRIKNSCGEAQTPDVQLTVRKMVRLVTPMEDVWACTLGGNVMVSSGFVNANGYYWYKEGAPEKCLSTKDYLFLTNFKEAMAGKYICRAGGSALDCNVVYDTCDVIYGVYPVITGIAKTDTVCEGLVWQTAVVNVDPSASVIWKHNEDTLNFEGSCYTVVPVSVADAGNYIVEATNKCGTKTHLLGTLYVDQPLVVDTVSSALQLACIGLSKELFIKVSPSNGKEKYEWNLDGKIVGRGNTYKIPAYTKGGTYLYQVWYTNKCTSGVSFKEVSVHVPEKLEFIEPERNISVCAGDMDEARLQITIDPALMANFRWYFQKSEGTTERVDLNSTEDHYTVPLLKSNSGYYYCEVYNECESKTTQTTWVRVDTVPTLQSRLENDTVCVNNDYTLTLASDGGSLNYSWQILKRNDLTAEEVNIPLKNELVFKNITEDYDSCQIWCTVKNDCGEVVSNTMILRVAGADNHLTVTPAILNTCDTSFQKVAVKIDGGGNPWKYKYLTPANEEKEVIVSTGRIDSLEIAEAGIYRITSFVDAVGCVVTDSLPEIEANLYSPAIVSLSGGGKKCQGDTASIHIHIEEGHGPWEITLVQQSGGYATDIADAYPIRMTARDTVLTFYVEKSDEYYIYQTVTDLGSSCGALMNTERIKVEMSVVPHISFRSGWPTHLGRCLSGINLRDLLVPTVDGGAITEGDFYVNDVALNGDQWLLGPVLSDCYNIKCQYADSNGCEVQSDEIRICVDSLPHGEVISSSVACQSVASYAEIQFWPIGGIGSVTLRLGRYKVWDPVTQPVITPRYSTVTYQGSDLSSTGILRLPLTWDKVDSPDSCLVVEVLDIVDLYGCHMKCTDESVYNRLYRDTIWCHWDPVATIAVRRPGETEWRSGLYNISLTKGDSICVKVRLEEGMPLWSLPDLNISSISGRDTILWLKEEGVYSFRPKDESCGRSAKNWPELKISYRETGYFRGFLWLEGPFDMDNHRMNSLIASRLGLPAPSSLSKLPSGLEVIDWLRIELRIGSDVDSVAQLLKPSFTFSVDSCLLLSNGQLADRHTGDTIVGIREACDAGSNYRYVVVSHRNHLGIMSKKPLHFVNGKEVANSQRLDFRESGNIYTRDGRYQDHLTYYSGVGWLLSGGELNTNFLITLFDPNRITLKDVDALSSGSVGYDVMHDINFDGVVDWPGWNQSDKTADWDIVKRNRQKFTEVNF